MRRCLGKLQILIREALIKTKLSLFATIVVQHVISEIILCVFYIVGWSQLRHLEFYVFYIDIVYRENIHSAHAHLFLLSRFMRRKADFSVIYLCLRRTCTFRGWNVMKCLPLKRLTTLGYSFRTVWMEIQFVTAIRGIILFRKKAGKSAIITFEKFQPPILIIFSIKKYNK